MHRQTDMRAAVRKQSSVGAAARKQSSSGSVVRKQASVKPGNVEVVQPTRAAYARAVKSELADLGLSYRQLAAQARRGDFTSLRARKLWLAIGKRPG